MASGKKKVQKASNKRKSSVKPVATIAEVGDFWDREINLETGYRGLVVEVVGRQNNELTFFILDGSGKTQKVNSGNPFTVNLDDGSVVWSSLPSTAPQVDPESAQRVGFLFLSPDWIAQQKGAKIQLEGDDWGKWPRTLSL